MWLNSCQIYSTWLIVWFFIEKLLVATSIMQKFNGHGLTRSRDDHKNVICTLHVNISSPNPPPHLITQPSMSSCTYNREQLPLAHAPRVNNDTDSFYLGSPHHISGIHIPYLHTSAHQLRVSLPSQSICLSLRNKREWKGINNKTNLKLS